MSDPVSLHINDYGTVFNITIKDQDDVVVDLSTGSGSIITFFPPHQDSFSRTPVMPNGGTDGLLRYTIQSGELSQAGIWSISAEIITPSGHFYSNVPEFRVLCNI